MSQITRVLMTADSIGGVWTYAIDLSRALGNLGIEVVLVSMGRKLREEQHRDIWSVPTLSVVEAPFKLEWMDDPWQDVDRAGELLLELERRHAPDIVHLNGYAHGALPFRAPVLVVAHSCVLSWWQAVHGTPAPAEYDVYRQRVQEGLHKADAVVAVTQAMLSSLSQHYGLVSGHVIPNGCDPELFVPEAKEDLVFSAGRFWDAAKNLAALVAVADRVPWPIYAAGDDQRPPGAGRGFELRAPTALHTLGPITRSELAGWLGRASIYVLPARYEPFGLSVLEAALSGCALVLGDIPSLRELWQDVALFVRPDEQDALAATINTLIDDPERRVALAERAREHALFYTLRALGPAYLGLYEKLVVREKPRTQRTVVAHP